MFKKIEKFIRNIKKNSGNCFLRSPIISKIIKYHINTKVEKISSEIIGKNNKINDEIIYVIGDSHSIFFSGQNYHNFIADKIFITPDVIIDKLISYIRYFEIYHLGPALAFNANNDKSSTHTLQKVKYLIENEIIAPNSQVVLSFGEIDIRAHSLKQGLSQNKPISEIVDAILANYLELILIFKNSGFDVCCWTPIASQKDIWGENPKFVKFGFERERNQVTELFINKLEGLAIEHVFKVCSIFNNMINENYETDENYISSDQCHLSNKALSLAIPELINKTVLKYK